MRKSTKNQSKNYLMIRVNGHITLSSRIKHTLIECRLKQITRLKQDLCSGFTRLCLNYLCLSFVFPLSFLYLPCVFLVSSLCLTCDFLRLPVFYLCICVFCPIVQTCPILIAGMGAMSMTSTCLYCCEYRGTHR